MYETQGNRFIFRLHIAGIPATAILQNSTPRKLIRIPLSTLSSLGTHDDMGAPNAIRVILLLLSAASFVPQYSRILSRRDCVGLAPNYILFNLIVATQQFSLGLYYVVANDEVDYVVHSPPTLGDWLNLAQFTVVWVGHLVLSVKPDLSNLWGSSSFGAYLFYPPSSPGPKTTILSIYIAFLLISVAPVIFMAFLPPTGTDPNRDRRWISAIFANTSGLLINPIVTALAIAAYFPQARELRSRPDVGALSVLGLAVQASVFLIVSIIWPLRMELPRGVSFSVWYQFAGWATVDNLIFAFVQAVLWWIARRFGRAVSEEPSEAAPLMGE
ncbi:hypothetical protein NM208_g13683 [Fusarium decemcellulare]|uniref:Uncharacterized protein n=1 Tax=Fusarium decemcellulare TaxID=57161 RepID=A0ACC1RLH2_9HYPO|nr:hypothetical protein NM208_g13683 [Fusarium decemcellulare]